MLFRSAPSRPLTNGASPVVSKPLPPPVKPPAPFPGAPATNGGSLSDAESDKSLKMKIKRTKSGRQEIVKTEGGQSNGDTSDNGDVTPTPGSPPSPHSINGDTTSDKLNHKVRLGIILQKEIILLLPPTLNILHSENFSP